MPGETDQVRWRGVRPVAGIRGVWPAIDAVRIWETGYYEGTGVAVVYTVPPGKKLFLSTAFLDTSSSIEPGGSGRLLVRDGDDVLVNRFYTHMYDTGGYMANGISFLPAIEVEAGWDVCVEASSSRMRSWGCITGWLEDA